MIPQDQLIGLCHEIAALVKWGLPLEPSLRSRSADLPKKLGCKIQDLSTQLESGQSLAEALKEDPAFPPVYATVIEAGLESGNLSGTLEMLTRHLCVLRDSRRFIIGAMLYPMFVFTIAWLMLTLLWFKMGHIYAAFFQDFSLRLPLLNNIAFPQTGFGEHALVMLMILAAVWLVYFIWQYQAARSVFLTLKPPRLFFWLRKSNQELTQAAFAGIVSLLVRSGVSLPKALWLAFQSVGDKTWSIKTEADIEKYLSAGDLSIPHRSVLTPLLRWLFRISEQKVLLYGLKQYSEMSAYKAQQRLERIELFLPMILMFTLGGFVLMLYMIAIVLPYGYLLYQAATIYN